MELLIPFLNAAIDRFRGSGDSYFIKCDIYAALLFAVVFSFYLPDPSLRSLIIIAILYKLGESSGWGNPLGSYVNDRSMSESGDYEWWQVGILKENVEAAMLVRGAMWGLPLSVYLYLQDPLLSIITFISFTVTFLLSPYIVKKLANKYEWDGSKEVWNRSEELRGFLVMVPMSLYSLLM